MFGPIVIKLSVQPHSYTPTSERSLGFRSGNELCGQLRIVDGEDC